MVSNSEWNLYEGFRKSERSGGQDNCVAVNLVADAERVGIRDTKDRGRGHVLVVSRPTFRAFVGAIKAGEFSE